MRALVGQLMPDGRAFKARSVDREGNPLGLLGQLKALLHGADSEIRRTLIEVLLSYDWALITVAPSPQIVSEFDTPNFVFVRSIGIGHNVSVEEPRQYQLADEPDAGTEWAYLWDTAGESLRVYTAARGQWHFVGSLGPHLLAGGQ